MWCRRITLGLLAAAFGCGRVGFDEPTDAIVVPPDGFGSAATACGPPMPSGNVVYVATSGDDITGTGLINAPYRTIQMTYDRVPPGTTILVQPGVYEPLDLSRTVSPQVITIAAVIPYTVTVQSTSYVVSCSFCTGVVFEGLYVHATTAGSIPVFHVNGGQDVVIRNCIIDNAGTSATVRLSGDPVNVTVSRNILFDGNPALHVAQVTGTILEDNVLVNTRMATGPMLWLEAPLGGTAMIRRNILAGFRGCTSCGMMDLRLDTGSRVESNLFVSGSAPSNGALGLQGSTNLTVQFNTVVGDLPGSAYALTGLMFGGTAVSGLVLTNNVFADPTATLGDFSDGTTTEITSAQVQSNAYWNGGQMIADDALDAVAPADDPQAVRADPKLPAFTDYVPLTWDAANLRFSDGSTSICDAFYRIALQYAMPAADSPLVGAATGIERPPDLLGFPRTKSTLGALEPP